MSDQTVVRLDSVRCRSYGICTSILPDVFDLPAGAPAAVLLRHEVDADDVDDLAEAVRACPAQAILQGPEPT
ncbi:ferredoxin [Rhodococcus sp. NKCM2511]|uniref:ferredoxin n=1 Tax=Rhodococcus sp. NKCM2511 TaxID=2766011 RepID=UPI00191117FE|nr:ferredoxin [Rhodococcus sp. NKCM2511]